LAFINLQKNARSVFLKVFAAKMSGVLWDVETSLLSEFLICLGLAVTHFFGFCTGSPGLEASGVFWGGGQM
jgi:hypothetical protein